MNVEIAHGYHKPIIYMVKNKEPQDFTLQGDGKKEDIPAESQQEQGMVMDKVPEGFIFTEEEDLKRFF